MTAHFTPKWKDKKGNILIFPARNTLFDSYQSAQEWQIGQFIFFVPFGLSPAGILEFEAIEGHAEIPHREGDFGVLGQCCILDGPYGPQPISSGQGTE